MMHNSLRLLTLALAVAGSSAVVGAAETTTYSGTGTYVVSRALLPLANGGAALQLSHDTVATVQPSESGFMHGDCAGLGYLAPDGGSSVKAICTFDLTQQDGFVVSLDGDPKADAQVEVLGGRGTFDGATGTGSIRRTYLEGDRGSYSFEFNITTP